MRRKGGEADEAAQRSAQADARRDFTKLPMAGTTGSSERGRSAEPAKAAGIAPWTSRQGNGDGLAPPPRPGGLPTRLRPRKGSGISARPSGGADFPKGDLRGLGPDASLQETVRLRPDRIRKGTFAAGFRSGPSGPTGIGEGLNRLLRRDPPGTERGLAASLRNPGKAAGAKPRRDPEAAQREMASPPSDGSQSWDKWGPVATPAPIIDSGPANCPPRQEPPSHRGRWRSKRTGATR
jgi:hypothetical protein